MGIPRESHQVRLHTERHGSGPPVLFTHGLGDTSATWCHQVEALRGGWHVTTWDLRGHGRSERPAEPAAYTREVGLGDLATVLEKSGQPAILVGHSLGGYLSLCYAIVHPEHVRGVVLIASGPGFRDPEARRRWNTTMIRKFCPPDDVAPAARALAIQPDGLAMEHLDKLTAPLLHIVGERDPQYHAAAAYLVRRLPRAHTVRIPGAGHLPHVSHAPVVNRHLESFLSRLDTPRGPTRPGVLESPGSVPSTEQPLPPRPINSKPHAGAT